MYTWAQLVCVLWLEGHAGPRAGLRRGGKEHNWGGAELGNKKSYFLLLTFTVLRK